MAAKGTKECTASGGMPSGMVIKNTFIEVGDAQSLLEISDWRRQMSDPGATLPRQISDMTNATNISDVDMVTLCTRDTSGTGDASQEEVMLDQPPSSEENTLAAGGVDNDQHDRLAGLPWPDDGADLGQRAQAAQILLLEDTIQRERKAKHGNRVTPGDRKEPRAKDNQINQIKNFDITHKEPPWTDVTTVIMRNLPNKYTQQMLLEELQDSSFRAGVDFDFFYLPMDHSSAANLGYCFINFTATAMANAFAAAFQLKRMRRFNSNKTVVVMPASIQGYEKNHAYYSSTRVVQADDPQYRPLFMKQGGSQQSNSARRTGCTPAVTKGAAKGCGRGDAAAARGQADNRSGKGKGKGGRETAAFRPELFAPVPFEPAPFVDPFSVVPMAPAAPLLGTYPALEAQSAPQNSTVVCQNCGNSCRAIHRFCAFCGSQITAFDQALQNNFLRADAPTFVMPPGEPESPRRGLPLLSVPPPEAQASDLATDELEIMRGRMMLLAALQELESRESSPPVF